MIRKINYKNTPPPAAEAGAKADKPKRQPSRLFTSTVEYTLIANLVVQQYQQGHDVLWDKVLSLPFEDRIPGLMERYGKKTMHKLLLMILKEFVGQMNLAAYKRPTETRVSVAACELMLTAHEDFLGIEDIILFLQRARAGYYGPIKTLVNMNLLLIQLDRYRQERHEAYMKLKEKREAEYKQLGPIERTAPQPTLLGDLFNQALVVDMNKKMSG
ncbi:hypothetical protein EPD60_15625 [Flaviaesturariibacter flavus]|uniref:Uncharacterized protein n=1 Tax=Flaviaesturariibacter flavus TaxID=2502780 RepID=A0A4R1B603_9BACT|nr:hypothetical protein [Flaviaesturariibacter flavus]TCJ11987.1 hypothetical protein EPD60_15625 [Flaviaesturariibacter flavus]